jgi:hypothetical protein
MQFLLLYRFVKALTEVHFLHEVLSRFIQHDRMIVGFTPTYAINSYNNGCCEFESPSG